MFDNIGGKIKKLAVVCTIVGIASFVIIGIVLMGDSFFTGLLTLVLGAVMSWIGSFTLYGLGQLIENTDELVAQSRNAQKASSSASSAPQVAPVMQAPYVPVQQTSFAPKQPDPEQPDPEQLHAPSQTPVAGIPAENGKFSCPVCGTLQNSNRRVCLHCGQKLLPDSLQ